MCAVRLMLLLTIGLIDAMCDGLIQQTNAVLNVPAHHFFFSHSEFRLLLLTFYNSPRLAVSVFCGYRCLQAIALRNLLWPP